MLYVLEIPDATAGQRFAQLVTRYAARISTVVEQGSALDCVKALLARLTLDELDAVQRQHIWTARTEALDRAKVPLTAQDPWDMSAIDAQQSAAEVDEDGDEVADPTPTVKCDPFAGVRQALDEADGD